MGCTAVSHWCYTGVALAVLHKAYDLKIDEQLM